MTKTFRYFAFGSNMLGRRLRSRTPSAVALGIGYLAGWRLRFDMASTDGSGKCDIERSTYRSDQVYGVLYEIPVVEKPSLDRAEGLGVGYREELVRVVTTDGVVTASAYIALVKNPELRPYHWYKDIVVAGAAEHGLPEAYVGWLRTHESKPDPDEARRMVHEILLRDS